MPNKVDGFTPLPAEPGLYDQLIDQQPHQQLTELAQTRLAPRRPDFLNDIGNQDIKR